MSNPYHEIRKIVAALALALLFASGTFSVVANLHRVQQLVLVCGFSLDFLQSCGLAAHLVGQMGANGPKGQSPCLSQAQVTAADNSSDLKQISF